MTTTRVVMSPCAAVAPLVVLALYVGGALVLYTHRNRRTTPFHDEEMDQRDAGGLTTAGLRHFFAWLVRPLWHALARAHFPPDVLTKLSLVIALGAGVGVAAGSFSLGGWLFLGSGLLDFLDGRVARATRTATRPGAALDSVFDRYVEAALLCGLAWYYRHDWVLVAALLALTGSLLVPYVRARGEALGVRLDDVGFMQRPERIAVLGLGTALSPAVDVFVATLVPHPRHVLAAAALVVLALSSHASAVQRTVRLLRRLSEDQAARPRWRFAKSSLASATATAVDFTLANALFFVVGLHGFAATGAGCVAGALVAFTLSRYRVFYASAGSAMVQLGRYAFAAAASAALNMGGVALLGALDAPFLVAWALTRAVVFAGFSYPMQRDFVFAETETRVEALGGRVTQAGGAARLGHPARYSVGSQASRSNADWTC